jgi:hypothetical protein
MSKSFGKKCGSLSCPKNILKVKWRAAGFDLVLPHNHAKIDKHMSKSFDKKCGSLSCPKTFLRGNRGPLALI